MKMSNSKVMYKTVVNRVGKQVIALICVLVLPGCQISNENEVLDKIDGKFKLNLEKMSNFNTLPNSVYVVIPRAGCGGCISSAEQFMLDCLRKNSENENVYFILTDFGSEKILRARFGQFYKKKHIIVDRNNLFATDRSLKSIYPTVYFYKESHLDKVTAVSPKEDGLSQIQTFLSENKQLKAN